MFKVNGCKMEGLEEVHGKFVAAFTQRPGTGAGVRTLRL